MNNLPKEKYIRVKCEGCGNPFTTYNDGRRRKNCSKVCGHTSQSRKITLKTFASTENALPKADVTANTYWKLIIQYQELKILYDDAQDVIHELLVIKK